LIRLRHLARRVLKSEFEGSIDPSCCSDGLTYKP